MKKKQQEEKKVISASHDQVSSNLIVIVLGTIFGHNLESELKQKSGFAPKFEDYAYLSRSLVEFK